MSKAVNIFDISQLFWSGVNGDFVGQGGLLKTNSNVTASGFTTSGITTSGIRFPSGANAGYILTTDALGNASWESVSAVTNGVTHLSITGLANISGDVSLIPSGIVVMAYSGNNIIVGAQTFNFPSTLPIASGGTNASTSGSARVNLGAAASGFNTDIYSLGSFVSHPSGFTTSGIQFTSGVTNGFFLKTDSNGNGSWASVSQWNGAGVTGLSITGQSAISGSIALIPSGITVVAYSGNNIILGTPIFNFPATLPIASGGTNASTSGNARANLGAAASGANGDIYSLLSFVSHPSGFTTSGIQFTSGVTNGFFLKTDSNGNGSWASVSQWNGAGVTGLAITGQSAISGSVALIASGSIQLAYSGNNIIIGTSLSSGVSAFKTITGSYSVTTSDSMIYVNGSGSGNFPIITCMDATQIPGRIFTIKKTDVSANLVLVSGSGAQTIDGSLGFTLLIPYQFVRIQSDGVNYNIV